MSGLVYAVLLFPASTQQHPSPVLTHEEVFQLKGWGLGADGCNRRKREPKEMTPWTI